MNNRSLEKALEIVTKLITGEEVGRNSTETASLYEEYSTNSEVYDIVITVIAKMNLSLYEYKDTLYVTAGENNRVFGYSNEELKKEIGVKLNRELYLCYFIIYTIITRFYKDSGSYTYVEYVRLEDIINGVDSSLAGVIGKLAVFSLDEVEENSFKDIALLWEDIPAVTSEDTMLRASRASKSGFVKMVLNFMLRQELMIEADGRYYPKDRLRALIENYFEEYKGRLYEIMKGGEEDATY